MSYAVKMLADSISPAGDRLTTMQVTYPHAVHKDIMTHRALSRNFLSFRAYPPEKLYDMVENDPFIPEEFGERVKGMGTGRVFGDELQGMCRDLWLDARDSALATTRKLVRLGASKQHANIPIQDYCWITGIVSATDWNNFFALRLDTDEDGRPKARPEVYKIASMMLDIYQQGEPTLLQYGQWHLPLVDLKEFWGPGNAYPCDGTYGYWKKVSVGRCARISYLTHDGVRDPEADIRLHGNLMEDAHMSPFEHQATPLCPDMAHPINNYLGEGEVHQAHHGARSGNFTGWHQYRADIPNQGDYSLRESA